MFLITASGPDAETAFGRAKLHERHYAMQPGTLTDRKAVRRFTLPRGREPMDYAKAVVKAGLLPANGAGAIRVDHDHWLLFGP